MGDSGMRWAGGKRKSSAGGNRPLRRQRRSSFQAQVPRLRRINARTAGFLGIEKKFYDTSLVGAIINAPLAAEGAEHNPSATITLNTVTQGDGESQRDGRKMVMKYITIKGCFHQQLNLNNANPAGAVDATIALVLDTQTNGSLLNSEQVYVNPSGSAQNALSVFRNLQYIQRYKVLKVLHVYGKTPNLGNDGTATTYDMSTAWGYFVMNVKLDDIPVNFSGTTETIANIVDNSLNIIAYSNDTGAESCLLNYNARLRFVG